MYFDGMDAGELVVVVRHGDTVIIEKVTDNQGLCWILYGNEISNLHGMTGRQAEFMYNCWY